jgi:hypothetical protein
LYDTARDAALFRAKVEVLARGLRRSATAAHPASRRSTCPSSNRTGWPARSTATCSSAAPTGPGREPR